MSTQTMSRTEAIRTASRAAIPLSVIWQARARRHGRDARTQWVARLALILMGMDPTTVEAEVYMAIEHGCTTVRDIVDRALAQRS